MKLRLWGGKPFDVPEAGETHGPARYAVYNRWCGHVFLVTSRRPLAAALAAELGAPAGFRVRVAVAGDDQAVTAGKCGRCRPAETAAAAAAGSHSNV
ncbi:hypothetical protein [Dactylosporangium sp. CS-033363]|uniref:hypothetical protein n=1 Tax=Dactylosporangium sp. CS-033363 TaxID=3239935 RepID=UPI003D8B172C